MTTKHTLTLYCWQCETETCHTSPNGTPADSECSKCGTFYKISDRNKPTEHTPGPWEIDYNDSSNPIIGADNQVVARVAHLAALRHPLEAKANACLIAAAPDMFKDLNKANKHIRQLCGMVNAYALKLGLGLKVHAEYFMVTDSMKKAAGQE